MDFETAKIVKYIAYISQLGLDVKLSEKITLPTLRLVEFWNKESEILGKEYNIAIPIKHAVADLVLNLLLLSQDSKYKIVPFVRRDPFIKGSDLDKIDHTK